MADYREWYLQMVRASEQAIRILIEAQQACEEALLQEDVPELRVISFPEREEAPAEK